MAYTFTGPMNERQLSRLRTLALQGMTVSEIAQRICRSIADTEAEIRRQRLPLVFNIADGAVRTGIRTDGVRSFDDLKARCVVDDETDCWVWQGTTNRGARLWLPAAGCTVNLSAAIGWLVCKGRPPRGAHWVPTCRNFECCNPAHRKRGTKADSMRAAITGRSAEERARISLTKRAASMVSDADCEAIRNSDEPLRVLSARYGISISHASRIRLGQLRRPVVAAASVFSWRPAA